MDSLTHELDVLLSEAIVTTGIIFVGGRGGLHSLLSITGISSATFSFLAVSSLLLLSNSSHLNLWSSILIDSGLILVLSLIHHGLSFLDKFTLALILELHTISIHLHVIIVILLRRHLILIITIFNKLLVLLLLSHALLLLSRSHPSLVLLVFLALPLCFLLSDTLFLFFLTATFLLLLLLSACLLLLSLSLLLLFGDGGLLLSLALSLHLLTHGLFLTAIILLRCSTIVSGATSINLLHVRGGIDTSCSSTEHSLQEQVGFLGFVTSNNLSRFHIDLFSNHEFRQLNQFDQKVDLSLLLSNGLGIQHISFEQSITISGGSHSSCEDIVQVSEGRLRQQLLGHLRLLEDLRIHLGGRLPKFVTHLSLVLFNIQI